MMSLEELARVILDRRLRPGAAQLRLLAEAVLAKEEAPDTSVKDAGGKAEKVNKSGKKKGKKSRRGKLAKIPKGSR